MPGPYLAFFILTERMHGGQEQGSLEVVGQQPFVFDIEDYMREWRAKIQSTIKRFPIGDRLGEWQAMLQK